MSKKSNVKKQVKEAKQKKVLLPYFVPPLLAIVIYVNTCNFTYTMDDDVYITQHHSVQKGLKGIGEIFSHGSLYGFNQVGGNQPYRPITLLSFALEKEFGKNSAPARHVINVLLYALTAIFLYQFLLLLFGEKRYMIAFFASILFIVHPVHT